MLHALGTVLGWTMYGTSPTYRRNLRANLALAGYTDAATRRAAISAAGQLLTETPAIWRVSFVAIAVVGGVSTFRLLRRSRARPALQGPLMRHQWTVVVVYALVAVIGAAPELASPLHIAPIQAEAILLILLVLMAHGLVWEFMVSAAEDDAAARS